MPIMKDMVKNFTSVSDLSVGKRVLAVDSLQKKSVKMGSRVKNELRSQEHSVAQNAKAINTLRRARLMKRVKEETKYMIGLVLMFTFTGGMLILISLLMLYLVAIIRAIG